MLNHGQNNSLSHGCFNILLFPPFLYNRWKGVALLRIDRITLVTPSYSVKPLCVGQHLHPCFSFCIPFFWQERHCIRQNSLKEETLSYSHFLACSKKKFAGLHKRQMSLKKLVRKADTQHSSCNAKKTKNTLLLKLWGDVYSLQFRAALACLLSSNQFSGFPGLKAD